MEEPPLEMVTLFKSSNFDAEQEALAIRALLEAEGVPSVLVGPSVLPVFEFRVEVPSERLDDARKIVAQAEEAGPAAADEAEAASEEGG